AWNRIYSKLMWNMHWIYSGGSGHQSPAKTWRICPAVALLPQWKPDSATREKLLAAQRIDVTRFSDAMK
ncbi:MAG: hypothetical protein LRZ88_11405, partial [Candidatus Cloacimonetes bacterium]|nr:hypothetical protein [Candidatus Cloacimonadota bacterium]